MVALCACGSSSEPPPERPIPVPARAATAGNALLALAPAGADVVLEVDLARLRQNQVVGPVLARLSALGGDETERAGTGEAPALPLVAGADFASSLAILRSVDAIVICAYDVGTERARALTLMTGVGADQLALVRDRGRRLDTGAGPDAPGPVWAMGPLELLDQASALSAGSEPSLAEDRALLAVRARVMPPAAPGASLRAAARLSFEARVALAGQLGLDRVPANMALWGDVADDLAIVAAFGTDPGEASSLARALTSLRARIAGLPWLRERYLHFTALSIDIREGKKRRPGGARHRAHATVAHDEARCPVSRGQSHGRREMTALIVEPAKKPLMGYSLVPGDKSIAHRALLFGALCHGRVRVSGVGAGGDNKKSARAMSALGATIEAVEPRPSPPDHKGRRAPRRPGSDVLITGAGLDGLTAAGSAIDCGNSGTTMRLLCGLLAGQRFATRLFGDHSLSGRPMRRVIDPLAAMGAVITGESGDKPENIYPPLQIAARDNPLAAIDYALPMASAQVKSAVLLAGLYADGKTTVREPGPSRDHTERMLAHMGAPVTVKPGGVIELDTAGWDRRLACDSITVPADPSQAAFILCAALMAGVERVTVGEVCINPTRIGFLDVLAHMGALIEREAMSTGGGEPTADLSISRGAGENLAGTIIEGGTVVRAIDEIPILAIVAARGRGVTEIRDAAELRVKESDRIAATCALLRGLGVTVQEKDDGMVIEGRGSEPFKGTQIHAQGDHRIAMSAAVAGLVADSPVRVDGAECVDTSFPGFADTLGALGAEIAVVAE